MKQKEKKKKQIKPPTCCKAMKHNQGYQDERAKAPGTGEREEGKQPSLPIFLLQGIC